MSANNSHWFPSAAELRFIEAAKNTTWTPAVVARHLNAPVAKVREIMEGGR